MSTKHKIANLVNKTCDESGTACRDWLQATATAVIENCHWRNRFWPKVNEPNLTRGRGSPQFAYVLLPPTLSQITTRSWNSKQRREGERSRADDTLHLTLPLSGELLTSATDQTMGCMGTLAFVLSQPARFDNYQSVPLTELTVLGFDTIKGCL